MAGTQTEEKSVWTLLWRIENFSYWDRECHGKKIKSPQFESIYVDRCRCYLHIFPKGKKEGDEHLRVQFHPNDWFQNVIVDCELSFLDGNASALTTGIIQNKKIKKDKPLNLPDCPMQEEVFQSKRSSFLPHDTLTVRCRLWCSIGNFVTSDHFSARSRIDVREASILFPHGFLRNLQLLDQDETIFLASLNGSTSVNKSLKCTYFLTDSSLSNAAVNFQISTTHDDDPFLLMCKLSILNTERKTVKCTEDRHKFNRSTLPQNWHFPHFLSMQELLENREIDSISTKIVAIASNISGIVESEFWGFERMECDFPRDDFTNTSETCIETKQQIGDGRDSSQQSDSVTILRENPLSIYNYQTLFDFELRSSGVSFPVHKIVLSARSPIFRAMFCGDMLESDSTSLNIPDVDAPTLNRMLTFLYTGTVADLQWEVAAKLYYAADKYQVLSLKQVCSFLLQSSVSVSNVCNILELADRHQDAELISFVHDFILSHYDEIVLSEEWDKFLDSDPHFAGKTMKKIYKKKVQLKS